MHHRAYPPITDANQNRAAEGLRVIEDYCRFYLQHKTLTDKSALLRKRIHKIMPQSLAQLQIRDTHKDQRAKEPPTPRKNSRDLLTANFKRVTEALRVLEEYTSNAAYNELRYDCYELEKNVLLQAAKPSINTGIYLISADPDILKKGLTWGVSLIQYRDNSASKEQIYNVCKELKPLAQKAKTPMIVNNFLDIALLLDADGFHSGQDDLDVDKQRQLLGDHKLIGKTSHNIQQGKKAQAQGADYVSVGPIWETPSKPGRKAIGFDYLKIAQAQLNIPYVAIGGIENKERFDQVQHYHPPMIGIVRAAEELPAWLAKNNS
ncbi:MAG: thiamine phosphate synthase [bacterium]